MNSWVGGSGHVQRRLRDLATEAGLCASLEQVVGSERDRTDVTIQCWPVRDSEGNRTHYNDGAFRRNTLHVDVAITDVTSDSNLQHYAKQGGAANARAKRKVDKYHEQCSPQLFLPGIIEAHGRLHQDFSKLLGHLAETQIENSDTEDSLSTGEKALLKARLVHHYYQHMSVALQKGIVHNFSISVGRIRTASAERTAAARGYRAAALTSSRVHQLIGRKERERAFGSQIPA